MNNIANKTTRPIVISKVYEISPKDGERYYKFNFLNGNRRINRSNVNKLKRSFEKYGWICEPIVIDRQFNIISGQHRYTAAMEMGIPIMYMISDSDVSIKAIQETSQAVRKWTKLDVAQSLADEGNINYINFMSLYNQFVKTGKIIPLNALLSVITRRYNADSCERILTDEGLLLSIEDMNEHIKTLSIIEDCVRPIRSNKRVGRFDYICKAVLFMIDNGADTEQLQKKIEAYFRDIHSVSNVMQALELLEDVYNKRVSSKNKMYFISKYKMYQETESV